VSDLVAGLEYNGMFSVAANGVMERTRRESAQDDIRLPMDRICLTVNNHFTRFISNEAMFRPNLVHGFSPA
jgi:hypothetical protein